MAPFTIDDLTALNDPRLEGLLRATGVDLDREIERLIVETAQPLIAAIAGRAARSGTAILPQDAEDITGTIHLRLIAKLRALASSPDEAVRDLDRYVATVTTNVVNDHFRKMFPQRARLKNRLRYTLTHDSRLGLWQAGDTLACGLEAWQHGQQSETPVAAEVPLDPGRASRTMLDSTRPADALVDVFAQARQAVAFDGLVAFTAAIWNVVDTPALEADLRLVGMPQQATIEQMETREYLRVLWAEVRELRPMQRKALLLNLRCGDAGDVAALLVLTGVVRFDDLAALLELAPESLAAIWNELPLDDLRIAAMLGVTRQQVINLRKSARERLTRRMSR